jgi:hypothetical protein
VSSLLNLCAKNGTQGVHAIQQPNYAAAPGLDASVARVQCSLAEDQAIRLFILSKQQRKQTESAKGEAM